MENINAKYGDILRMQCCCCDAETNGRQWHYQNTGKTLCTHCISVCTTTTEEFGLRYGQRGIHYALPEQHEIDAIVETAMQVMARHSYTTTCLIVQRHTSATTCSLGFHFASGLLVGDIKFDEDGSWCVVVAVLPVSSDLASGREIKL